MEWDKLSQLVLPVGFQILDSEKLQFYLSCYSYLPKHCRSALLCQLVFPPACQAWSLSSEAQKSLWQTNDSDTIRFASWDHQTLLLAYLWKGRATKCLDAARSNHYSEAGESLLVFGSLPRMKERHSLCHETIMHCQNVSRRWSLAIHLHWPDPYGKNPRLGQRSNICTLSASVIPL